VEGFRGSYALWTFGCQMNVHDSEHLAGVLEDMGYRPAENARQADVVLINTCSVREKPEQKVYSLLGDLRKLKQERPGAIIGVCGCMAQVREREILERAPYVDIILGPRSLPKLREAILRAQQDHTPAIETALDVEMPEDLPVRRESKHSALVTISHGCNNRCAFCIVPAARGRERSRPMEQIVREVAALVEDGVVEVTLLGQNVNSYGRDLQPQVEFADLLQALNQIGGLRRIRFTSPHPKDVSDRAIEAMTLPAVCEHFHLPLQSGDDTVLRRMRRGYTMQRYRDIVRRLRERVPDIAITTDLIVGFPGETEEQFGNTLRAVEEIRFDQAFMFKFNARPGTPAAEFEDQVPEDIRQRRLEELVALQNEIGREINRKLEGRVFEVLVEGQGEDGKWRGRTRQNKLVLLTSPPAPLPSGEGRPAGPEPLTCSCLPSGEGQGVRSSGLAGCFVNVRVTQGFVWGFLGEMVD
jgi:tRNA-2-methylthio-N6-dimethylallyladenosine synthase